MRRASPLAREAVFSAGVAASFAALLAWAGPPGTDLAAHVYQRAVFLDHGFTLWNNFWYAGRYSFVTYSLLYYPLAAVVGIRLLAVATVAIATLAFAVVVWKEWGPRARWSSRAFAVVWAGIVLSAAFPFVLGAALALLALWALQARRPWRFAALAGADGRRQPDRLPPPRPDRRRTGDRTAVRPLAPDRGRQRPAGDRPARGAALARLPDERPVPLLDRRARRRLHVLRAVGGVRLAGRRAARGAVRLPRLRDRVHAFFFLSTAVGENIARLRYAAIPLSVLVLSLRAWRPRIPALIVFALAVSWNVTPLAASYLRAEDNAAAHAAYWQPAISYLHAHLTPSYRVEAVDTAGHWPALYLARSDIPLARGWFRQDDFPQNEVLYDELGPKAYVGWLRTLGVKYVVLTDAPVDYSARGEAALLRSGRSPLRPVFRSMHLTVFEVPHATPILTGRPGARVVSLTESKIVVAAERAGRYRLAVRFSRYWRPSAGCASRAADGMIRLTIPRPGRVSLKFAPNAKSALAALAGRSSRACAR